VGNYDKGKLPAPVLHDELDSRQPPGRSTNCLWIWKDKTAAENPGFCADLLQIISPDLFILGSGPSELTLYAVIAIVLEPDHKIRTQIRLALDRSTSSCGKPHSVRMHAETVLMLAHRRP